MMISDEQNFNCRFVGGDVRRRPGMDEISGAYIYTDRGSDFIYPTKLECLKTLVQKMDKYPATGHKIYNYNCNYTSPFNSWLMASGYSFSTCTAKDYPHKELRDRRAEVLREIRWSTREGFVEIKVRKNASTSRFANNLICFDIFNKVHQTLAKLEDEIYLATKLNQTDKSKFPQVQMDKSTEQGLPTQSSDRQQNTIITMDQDQSVIVPNRALDVLHKHASSEGFHVYGTLTERWMPLKTMKVSTSLKYNDFVTSMYLPENLYTDAGVAPNLAPFSSYIYGRVEIEVKAVVNSNKFCCGKLVLSSKYDSYQADSVQNGCQSALGRNHIILDLATNNEGILNIPFRFHRPWMRLVKNDRNSPAVRPSKFCTVYIHVLSPLQTGTDGPSEIGMRLFYRFKKAEFTGMSFRVNVQGLGIEDVVSEPTCRALKEILVGAEKAFDQLGKSRNQDKPSLVDGCIIIPRPRLNFGSGKGLIDVQPLRVNPHTMTNFDQITLPTDEPLSFLDLARIWGVYSEETWKKDQAAGTVLLSLSIDPTARHYNKDYLGEITPLEYACANFMFWSGTIELRFDFVSNAFHTGTIQISAEFGRTTSSETESESSSTYTKVFHLGEQKSVSFRVPYIYDTIMRRTTDCIYNPYRKKVPDAALKNAALSIAPESNTFVKVRIINPLRPIASAPQEIKILTFIRAGPDFVMHGLRGFGLRSFTIKEAINNFPENGYVKAPEDPAVKNQVQVRNRNRTVASTLPKADSNEWNEYNAVRLPKVQMDNGEKEDQDPTDNFRPGPSNQVVQTLDCHLSFKDLLRRPALLVNRYKLVAKDMEKCGGFFLPLMPPSRNLSYLLSETVDQANGIFARTLQDTSAKAIMDLFRLWRGGMRYTIVILEGKHPLYVSLIPHSGVRIIGPHTVIDEESYPIYGANFTTEIITPIVNPTAVIEAPYDTENTWTYTFEAEPNFNYSWRDKGDTNAGHIVLQPIGDTTVDIWWSAADDFEVANFYGIPYVKQNGWCYRYNDKMPTTQMDFHLEDISTTVNYVKSHISTTNVARACVAAIPWVGPGLVGGRALDDANRVINRTANNLTDNLDKLTGLADKLSCDIGSVTEAINLAISQLGNTLSSIVGGVQLCADFILDLIIAWMEKSWRVVAIGIVRFVLKLLPGQVGNIWDKLASFVEPLYICIRNMFTPLPQTQVENNSTTTLVGILLGLVGTLFGVSLDHRRNRPFCLSLLERFTETSGISYLLNVLRFVQNIFGVLKELVMEALGYASPETIALKKLAENNAVINGFIKEAQIVTSESNSACLNSAKYRRRFWKTVLTAHQLQRLMCEVPNNCVSSQLSRLCNQVIKVGNEKFMDVSASPVRFEPMVICIEGDAGIGKSHATEEIVHRLLKKVGFSKPSSELIFYRVAGEKFWSGYRDQPVVVYDEWLNVNDAQRCTDMITEMMKIKSTSIFIPEMAHLDEKKIRGNPYLVIMLCNSAYPTISDYARTPKAVFRRRDIVLKGFRSSNYVDVDLRDYSPEDLRDCPHLEFDIHKSATRPSLCGQKKSFTETMKFLENRFERYWIREQVEVKKRMERLPDFAASTNVESIRLEDPFSLFYELNHRVQVNEELSQNGWTPYEQLEVAVNSVCEAIESHQQQVVVPTEVPDKLEWKDLCSGSSTQGWFSALIGSCIDGAPLNLLASATLPQLVKWENSISPLRQVVSECCVCKEETECAFVCGHTINGENKHFLCLQCRTGCVGSGHNDCPMCRCPEVIPYLDREDICALSLWSQLVLRFNYGLQWICNKVMSWYGVKQRYPHVSQITDYCLCIVATIGHIKTGCTSAPSYLMGHAATSIMKTYLSNTVAEVRDIVTQSDAWDDVDEVAGPSTQIDVPITADNFNSELNEQEFEKCLGQVNDHKVCLHNLLWDTTGVPIMRGETWIVTDPQGNQRLNISIYPCKTLSCPLHDKAQYKLRLESYNLRHKRELRGLYINYFNNPSDEYLNLIPRLFWAPWMTDYKEPPIDNWWDKIVGYYGMYKEFIMYLSGVVGILFGMYKIYSLVHTSSTSGAIQFGGSEYAADSPRHRKATVKRSERKYFIQAEDKETPFNTAQRYICRNLILFTLQCSNGVKKMYGVGLFGHYVLIPRHYAKAIRMYYEEGGLTAEPYSRPHERQNLVFDKISIVESDTDDIAYFKLPSSFQLFKDIRKFLCTEEDLQKPLPNYGILMACPSKGVDYIREICTDIYGIQDRQVIVDQEHEAFVVRDVLTYRYSKAGACGSIMLRENHNRPILSMHFAGSGEGFHGEGFGVLLTQESLAVLVQLNDEPNQFEDREFDSIEKANFVFDDSINLHYLGSVTQSEVPFIPGDSSLVKSKIFGADGLKTILEPAILHKNDPRYVHQSTPLYEGIKKHGKLTNNFPQELLNKAKQMLYNGWISNMVPGVADPRILSVEDAIVGFPGMKYYRGLDLKTSAGYPYILSNRKKKLDYIEPIRDSQEQIIGIKSLDPQLEKVLEYKEGLRKQGIIPLTYFVDTLKDEKRKHDKVVKAGGTRVFCSSPLDYSIECRKYFMHFIAAFMEQRMSLMHGVGINPTSSEWGDLVSKLLRKNSKFIAIDYSNFGPGYNAGVAEMAYEIMVDWTMEKVPGCDRRYLRTLIWECIQSTHIANNTVYQQHGGSPSGAVFTTIVNTIVNQLYILIAWSEIMGKRALQEKRSLVQMFKDEVCMFTYGDDLIMTVTDEYIEDFNTVTITDFFSKFNIVATSADKTAEIVKFLKLSEATFLKRGFKPHPNRRGQWLSPLDWESVIGATQWVWKSVDLNGATLINCNAALLQAHGHGPHKYAYFQKILNRALIKYRLPATTMMWEEIDELYFTEGLEYITDKFINQF